MKSTLPRGRKITRAGRIGACLVAAVVAWAGAFSSCVRRDLSVTLPPSAPHSDEAWALEWRRSGSDAFNGVWLEFGAPGTVGQITLARRLPSYPIDELRLIGPDDAPIAGENLTTLTVRLLGWDVAHRPGDIVRVAATADPAPAVPSEAAVSPTPIATIDIDTSRPAWLHVVGVAALWASFALLYLGFRAAGRGLAWIGARLPCAGSSAAAMERPPGVWWPWKAAVAAIIVAVHVWAGVSSPLILTGDAVDYLTGGSELARTGSIAALPAFKAPLYPAIAGIPFATGLDALTFMKIAMVACGVLTCWLVYRAVREVCSERAGLVAALVCGLNPLLITLEAYLLRETFAAAVIAAVSLGLARLISGQARSRLPLAIWLGALAGLGALLRENFQTLLAILPAAIFLLPSVGSTWRSRLTASAACLAVGLACAGPWYAYHAHRFHHIGMTLPKVNMNRAINAWTNGVLDLNQTRTTSHQTWRDLQKRLRNGPLGDFAAVNSVIVAPRTGAPPLISRRPSHGATELAVYVERATAIMVNESTARAPERQWKARLAAAASLTGLCSFPHHPSATVMTWLSSPLRGEPSGDATSVRTGPIPGSYVERWSRLAPLLERHEVPLSSGVSPAFATCFDRLWSCNQPLRPVLAALTILAFLTAWRRRAWAIVAIGLVIALNLLGAAWVVVTPVDRVAVPFIPGMIVIAVWVAWAWFADAASRIRSRPDRLSTESV